MLNRTVYQRACGAVLGVALSVLAVPAMAVTFTLTGGENYVLPANYNPSPSTAPFLVAGDTVVRNATLGLSQRGIVTFTYIGKEASDNNFFQVGGTEIFNNQSTVPGTTHVADLPGGVLDIAFRMTNPVGTIPNPSDPGAYQPSIAYFLTTPGMNTVYALFNDACNCDKDYDDMVIKMTVAAVPLPAPIFLLLGGLAGLGFVARRRRRAAIA